MIHHQVLTFGSKAAIVAFRTRPMLFPFMSAFGPGVGESFGLAVVVFATVRLLNSCWCYDGHYATRPSILWYNCLITS